MSKRSASEIFFGHVSAIPHGKGRRMMELAGLDNTTLTRWRKAGRANPELATIEGLAQALGTTVAALISEDDGRTGAVELDSKEFVTVPISHGVAAGQPRFEPEHDEPTRLAFRRQWVQQFTTTIDDRNVWLARITGDSMHPTIKDGGMVLVTRWLTPEREDAPKIEDGKIYLLQSEDEDEGHTVKRLALVDHHVVVYADNPTFKPYKIDLESRDARQIILGRVRWIANEEP